MEAIVAATVVVVAGTVTIEAEGTETIAVDEAAMNTEVLATEVEVEEAARSLRLSSG